MLTLPSIVMFYCRRSLTINWIVLWSPLTSILSLSPCRIVESGHAVLNSALLLFPLAPSIPDTPTRQFRPFPLLRSASLPRSRHLLFLTKRLGFADPRSRRYSSTKHNSLSQGRGSAVSRDPGCTTGQYRVLCYCVFAGWIEY